MCGRAPWCNARSTASSSAPRRPGRVRSTASTASRTRPPRRAARAAPSTSARHHHGSACSPQLPKPSNRLRCTRPERRSRTAVASAHSEKPRRRSASIVPGEASHRGAANVSVGSRGARAAPRPRRSATPPRERAARRTPPGARSWRPSARPRPRSGRRCGRSRAAAPRPPRAAVPAASRPARGRGARRAARARRCGRRARRSGWWRRPASTGGFRTARRSAVRSRFP